MNDVIVYILKVIAIHGIFYMLYRLMFHKSARHALNRVYLISALILAFIIPFLSLPSFQDESILVADTPAIHWLAEPSNALEQFELIALEKEILFSW
ncbi:MAG: hypothetical protein AAFY41_05085, partial [Bacteroidota bacterium]